MLEPCLLQPCFHVAGTAITQTQSLPISLSQARCRQLRGVEKHGHQPQWGALIIIIFVSNILFVLSFLSLLLLLSSLLLSLSLSLLSLLVSLQLIINSNHVYYEHM